MVYIGVAFRVPRPFRNASGWHSGRVPRSANRTTVVRATGEPPFVSLMTHILRQNGFATLSRMSRIVGEIIRDSGLFLE